MKRRYKKTGEKKLFLEIWNERDHVSQISGQQLPEKDTQMWHWCFMHVLSKGAFPMYRLKKDNILLATPSEHYLYDSHTDKVIDIPQWKFVFELKQSLRQQYFDERFTRR